jgi:hypothetical protein
MTDDSLTSMDLVRIADQIERDRELGWQELQSRDYAIGQRCQHRDTTKRLLCWLDATAVDEQAAITGPGPGLSEASLGLLISGGMFVLGFATMAGFLLSHTLGFINVLWFFAFFVLLQLVLCLVSGFTLLAVLTGTSSATFTLNPAKLVYARALPDKRYWREFRSIFQLIFMRYSQGMGVGFICGSLTAFLLILAVNDFSFTWSSTFNLSNAAVLQFADIAAMPWAPFFPAGTVDADIIANSRYHPTAGKLSPQQVLSVHSWWPFLLASMLFYTLLPRLLLWLLSRVLYRAGLKKAFRTYPGVDLVLQRMAQPTVHTQATREDTRTSAGASPTAIPREDVLLVSWGAAIAQEELDDYAELAGLHSQQVALAGLSLDGDGEALRRAADQGISLVMLAVKSWEPPMSELADFIAELQPLGPCALFLKPLKGGAVDPNAMIDWQRFSSQLATGEIALNTFTPCATTATGTRGQP